MSRLIWGTYGERFYEAGVDRGVLYVAGLSGVAWNGLLSVAESPSGGDATPYYIDGVKYLNISSSEEYEAVLTALSHPAQFEACNGSLMIHNGLFATQQPRKSFGLSYRTLVGNDSNGIDHGYKLHLVYGALAAPSQRTNRSLGGSAEPSAFSWSITTKPPAVAGLKRTAHYVIDSRSTDSVILAEIEDLLYGTETEDAELPTPDELIAIFAP